MTQPALWVIKLGGSLASSPRLPLWLEALSHTQAVIVPGGGPFADAVREAQRRWHFDEPSAHHMAILAMRQYGLMLAGMNPRLLPARTHELGGNPRRARVWLPEPLELDRAGIPATWDISSDSLAAWLAGHVHAGHLLLVKSIEGLASREALPSLNTAQLAKLGWVDAAFPEYAARSGCQSWLCGPDDHTLLVPALTEPGPPFIPLHH